MQFTKEDFKTIEEGLRRIAVKDTEFNEASIPLNGGELLALIQDGQNKKMSVQKLTQEMSTLNLPDFINMTVAFNLSKASLEEVIQLVPTKVRKPGLYITFIEKNGFWGTFQYSGSTITQWNIPTLWERKG